jgi:uncharacterized membrane protein
LKKRFDVYTSSVASAFIFGIASISLFVLILVLGFQNRSLADVFGGKFDYFDSAQDIILTFVVPATLMLGFSIMAFMIIINIKKGIDGQ